MNSRKQALYRFFGPDGGLLYVGITMNPAARWPKHAATKQWWHDVETITVETFDSRNEALEAEREAIKTERPTYNIVHAEVRRGEAVTAAPAVLRWACAECGGDITGKDGALWVSVPEAYGYGDFLAGLQDPGRSWRPIDLAALLEGPDPAPWRAAHERCRDVTWSSLEPIYAIGIDRLKTPAQMLGFTAHLMGKKWLEWTNWDAIIGKAATQGGDR